MTDYKTGYRIEDEDHQFLAATSTPLLFSATVLPERVSYKDKGVRIENQGQFGSCGGHAGSTVLECLNYLDTGRWVQLSRWWCYIAAQREDGFNGKDAGCSISGLAKAMQKRGVCLETSLPYPDRYRDVLPQSAAEEAAKHKIKAWSRLPTADKVRQFIGSGLGFPAIGIPWMKGFDTGEISSRTYRGQNIGGHALAITGYNDAKDYFEIPNSWGTQAGVGGWFYMSYEFYDKIMAGGQSEGIGFSDLQEFRQPRTFGGMA